MRLIRAGGVCVRTGRGRHSGTGVYWLYMLMGRGTYSGTGMGSTMTLGPTVSTKEAEAEPLVLEGGHSSCIPP